MSAVDGMAVVVVMAKAPIPGKVKTRLEPRLGATGAARLQAELITHTTELAVTVARTLVAVDPPEALDGVGELVPRAVELFAQTDGALGARMQAAVETAFARTGLPVIVVGTDAPTLTSGLLARAGQLLRCGDDVVIGPALDGGYYLIGLAVPTPTAFSIAPALWGGGRVLRETLDVVAGSGRKVRLLEPLRDLDTPADADALVVDPNLPAGIAQLLAPRGAVV